MKSDEEKVIRDPIHGDISLTYSDIKLIDTFPIQRLRNIAQLGTVQWVFPGAKSSRFEHTIGVSHIAKKIARNMLEPDEYRDQRDLLSAAAIFHDAGHAPFSHTLEEFHIPLDHEKRSAALAREFVDKCQVTFSGQEIEKILNGQSDYLSQIISGTIDADRLDYLQRDAFHTGVSYGVIDSRILSHLKLKENTLVIDEKVVIPAETVLFARYVMRGIVYDHKVARSIGAMISKAVEYAMGRSEENYTNRLSTDDILKCNDIQLLEKLKNYTHSKNLIERLESRDILKLAGISFKKELKEHQLLDEFAQMQNETRQEYEDSISSNLNLEPYEIIIDKPNLTRYTVQEAKIPVYRGNKRLDELKNVSKLATPINDQHEMLWGIRLFAPEKYLNDARAMFKKVTNLSLDPPIKISRKSR